MQLPVFLYAATVPAFLQILECQTSLIHKGAAHADSNGIPRKNILCGRRRQGDHSFRTQIRLGTRVAFESVTLLTKQNASLPRPPFDSFESLDRYVSAAKNYLRSVEEDQFRDAESEIFQLKAPGGDPVDATAAELIFSHTYPVFYYHTVSAHAVLMHLGVAVQNWEFYNPPG